MGTNLRELRRRVRDARRRAAKRYVRHRRANLMARPGPYEFVVVLDHLKPRFNIGKIFRSADAFGAREVHLVGIDFFDPAPAMGSFKWVPARFHERFDTCHAELSDRGYTLFALAPEGGEPLPEVPLPPKSAFILGHEEFGLSLDPSAYPGIRPVAIPQVGRVQSLNVSVAASVAMYEYVRRYARR